ncbi:MAG: hypothetical protein GXO29_02355 [Thermotogae bacterium]|nr:hypothetical protein [Thermotogota bacterium]
MRYTALLSLLLLSCSVPFLRRSPPPYEKIVVVISADGKGLSAVIPDTVVPLVKVSILTDYGRRDFAFSKSVHFGYVDYNTNSYMMDPRAVAILEADVEGPLYEARLRINRSLKKLRVPDSTEILKPDSNLQDWDSLRVVWRGSAKRYILRMYAFTAMYQKDELVLVDSTSYTFDLGYMYGNGFVSVEICPVDGSPPDSNEKVKVFVLGECRRRTILVGDPSVWEGETPEPPWNDDDLLWYLLTL